MRYRLRMLLILLVVSPPLLAGAWWTRQPANPEQIKRDTATARLLMLKEAIDTYLLDMGSLPPNLKAVVEAPTIPVARRKWHGPYLHDRSVLVDPWNGEFLYEITNQKHSTYRLGSVGRDGMAGTSDDLFAFVYAF